ncbi:MAG: ATP-binding cassette domain-containing protein, partial [Reyranella sp.]
MTSLASSPPLLLREAHIVLDGYVVADRLSLDFAAGRTTCLLGRSGVGKTSLLRHLAGDRKS